MNKQELITEIQAKMEESKPTKILTSEFIETFIQVVEETLAKGEKVSLVGFGTFEAIEQKGREGECKIPTAMGKKWKSEDKFVPKFKAGKEFKEKVAKR